MESAAAVWLACFGCIGLTAGLSTVDCSAVHMLVSRHEKGISCCCTTCSGVEFSALADMLLRIASVHCCDNLSLVAPLVCVAVSGGVVVVVAAAAKTTWQDQDLHM